MDNKDFDKLHKYVEDRNKYDKNMEDKNAKKRLMNNIKRDMTTIMIGAISEFEKHFGDDWGHGLTDKDRTDEQLDDKAVWNQCREKIMDLGNSLIKNMEKQFNNYKIEQLKYHMKFYIKKDE